MRQLITSLSVLLIVHLATVPVQAQTREQQVEQRVQLLNATVFGTKDSARLNDLFAKQLTYGHSGGHLENRQEALHHASTNGNVYANTHMQDFDVFFTDNKTAIVRYAVHFDQTTKGVMAPHYLGMLQVWVKEGNDWRLTARQAVTLKE